MLEGNNFQFEGQGRPRAGQSIVSCLYVFFVSFCFLLPRAAGQGSGLPIDLPEEGVTIPSEYELTNFRNPLFRPISYGVDPQLKAGTGVIQLPSLGLSLMALDDLVDAALRTQFLERGGRPPDAELRLGFFFLDIASVTAAVLASDNVYLNDDDREADAIGVISLDDIQGVFVFGENTRIALSGDFIVLPFEGKMGLNGFGIRRDLLGLALRGDVGIGQGSLGAGGFQGIFTHDFKLAGWDFLVADRFGLEDFDVYESFDSFLSDKLLVAEGAESKPLVFDEEDRAGEYAYGPGAGMAREESASTRQEDWWGWRNQWRDEEGRKEYSPRDDSERNVELFNTLSLSATRDAPAQIRPSFSVYRTQADQLYAEDGTQSEDTEWREGAIVSLEVDRPSMRFPPYASFALTRESSEPGWRKLARLGVRGPAEVTRNMFFYGDVGYTMGPRDEEESWLYSFHLQHMPRRTTRHGLSIVRYVAEPENEVRSEVSYLLNQILGPHLTGSLVGGWTKEEEGAAEGEGEEEWGGGFGLFFRSPSRKLSLGLREIYVVEERGSAAGGTEARWETTLDARYVFNEHLRFTYRYGRDEKDEEWDSILSANYGIHLWRNELDGALRLDYRFTWRDSNEGRDTYWENLVVLSYRRPI